MAIGDGLGNIKDYLLKNKNQHIERIQRLVRQPSVSTENNGIQECAELVARYHKDLGFQQVDIVDTGGLPGVWAHYDAGAPKTIAVYWNFDTRPVLPHEKWDVDPFSGTLMASSPYDKVIVGRGASAKGSYVAFLSALEAMINVEGGLPVNVMALLEGDEILGSPSFRGMFEKYFKQLSTADVSFSPGASQNAKGVSSMNLGSKGMIYAELIASGAAWGRGPQGGPLHGMTKSVVDSPVWRLVHALSSLTESDGNTVAVKGFYDDLIPPTDEERKAAAAYALRTGGQGWNHILNGLTGVKAPAGDLNDEDTILNFFYGPSFNINGMRSGFIGPGTLPFSLPHEASARFDIRVPRGYKVDKTINLIRDHLSSNGYGDLEFRVMGAYDSSYTGTDTELVQSICRAFELMEVPLLIAPYSGGGGPWSLYTTELGIPMIRSVGVGGGGNAPGLGEFMVIDGTDKMGGLVECELSHVHMLKSYAEGV